MWLQWRAVYLERLVLEDKMDIARVHHAKRQEHSVLRAWQDYIEIRRVKHYLRRVGTGFHTSTLVSRTFSCWKARFLRRKELQELEEVMVQKGKLFTCRRAMEQWKFCILTMNIQSDSVYKCHYLTPHFRCCPVSA